MSQFENVTVVKKSNVFFDGKCVSHTVLFPDGSRKTVGVIFPGSLTFKVGALETMEITHGHCRVRIGSQSDWTSYSAGQRFTVPANSSFEIETAESVDYVCHFG
jgi:uncharacterized protein YaiE (UPF0345 family)